MIGLVKLFNEYRDAKTVAAREDCGVAIVELANPRLWAYVRSRSSLNDGEDVLQEVWAGIFKRIGLFRGGSDHEASGFCYFIARNKCADYVRKVVKTPESPYDLEELQMAVDASVQDSPLKPGELQDLEYAMGLLAAAKPPCADIINDKHILGLSYDEMGDRYQMSVDAIRMKAVRCLELVQTLVARKEAHV